MEEKINVNDKELDSETISNTNNSPENQNGDKCESRDLKNQSEDLSTKEQKLEAKKENTSTINNKVEVDSVDKVEIKPKKEIPIEKKPFLEFINSHLLPEIQEELIKRGLVVEEINIENTKRPIAGDKCWVVYCKIKDTCDFWLSFEKDDITSKKSFSLSKNNQEASIIESFLIDEKRITLKLIMSRIFQRLNGQKLLGVN